MPRNNNNNNNNEDLENAATEQARKDAADAEQQAKAEQAMRDEIQRKLDEANERAEQQLARIEEVRNRKR